MMKRTSKVLFSTDQIRAGAEFLLDSAKNTLILLMGLLITQPIKVIESIVLTVICTLMIVYGILLLRDMPERKHQ